MSPVPVDPGAAVSHDPALASDINARFDELYKTLDPAERGVDTTNLATTLMALIFKPGMIGITGAATADDGWLLCDGAAVSRVTYSALFGRIGTTFGAGDASTTFNVPDLRGRVPVAIDGAAARLTANDALGNASGEEKHALANSEMAQFLTNFAGAGFASLTPGAGVDILTNGTAGATGAPHNNMQPFQVVQYQIKT
jgi:microcystin-dependent protein